METSSTTASDCSTTSKSSSASSDISGIAGADAHGSALSASKASPLLRQLWLLLRGRYYSPWMLWFAAALDRAGEQRLACEAAAHGMLPSCCHFWDMNGVKRVYAACLTSLLPTLAQSSEHLLD